MLFNYDVTYPLSFNVGWNQILFKSFNASQHIRQALKAKKEDINSEEIKTEETNQNGNEINPQNGNEIELQNENDIKPLNGNDIKPQNGNVVSPI